jgi:hypothetical protein
LVVPAAVLRFRAAPLLVLATLMELVAGLLLPGLIIAHQFEVRLRRSFQAWVPTLAV